ncbi:MAG: HNH endonuclease [Deltaproteobacteria bacterium]|nr:HNH endonuclease [Deltaproteobacteria bacterium]
MTRKPKVLAVEVLTKEIDEKLKHFSISASKLSLREKVLRLVDIRRSVNDLGVSVAVEDGLSRTAARDRIESYIVRHVSVIIDGEELAVVSGISEYARRVRELRTEKGYRIVSGASNDADSGLNLKPDQYLLLAPEPDLDSARRWLIANRIRREDGSIQNRLLEFFKANVGKVVTTEELSYVAKTKGGDSFTRRIRELRTEHGYAIATIFTGRPDLAMGEYIMLSTDRVAKEHDRHIPMDVQREVYERDKNTCRLDGWSMEKWSKEDPRILELHHLKAHVKGGENIAKNLLVLCSRCHDDIHANRRTIPPEALP